MQAANAIQETQLLKEILHGEGPLKLLKKVQKIRLAYPAWTMNACIEQAVSNTHITPTDHQLKNELETHGIKIVSFFDQAYPLMLKGIEDPPPLLFYRGSLSQLHRPGLAVVGSRKATALGLQITRKFTGELARMGFVIISGLARGVDGAAHQAALEVGGHTIAVLGCGLDRIYPPEHRELAHGMIDSDNLIISEYPPGTAPKPFHFPIRNRIISGLSHGVLVVEAAARSGSLSTANHALNQGRQLFAIPGSIVNEQAKGPNSLIAKGEAHLFQSCETILENLPSLITLASAHEGQKAVAIKDPLARKIYDTLDAFEPTPLDLLTSKLGESAPVVTAKLVALETQFLVTRQPGPVYFRNPLQAPAQE